MRTPKNVVSVKQLAERLSLSPGTVSLVLNGRGNEMRISQMTQKRILDEAREMGYRPNIHAKRLRQGSGGSRGPLIAVFCPIHPTGTALGRFMYGVQMALVSEGLKAEILFQPFEYDKLSEYASLISDNCCNGAIITSLTEKDTAFLIEQNFNIPIVLFNRLTEKYSTVYVDDYEAGRKTAELFKARGHRQVGIIASTSRSKSGSLRRIGFLDGCHQVGLSCDRRHIQEAELSVEGGKIAAKKLIESGELPSALFIQISEMAAGALQTLRAANIDIPDEMEIVAYGDNPFDMMVSPTLTSIHMPMEEMSIECIRMLLRMLQTGNWTTVSQVYPLDFVYRESCGPFPGTQ